MDQCLWKPDILNEKQGRVTTYCMHRPFGVYAFESVEQSVRPSVHPPSCVLFTVRNFLVAVRKGRTSRAAYASNSPLATRDDEQVCVEAVGQGADTNRALHPIWCSFLLPPPQALYVLQRNEYDPSKALQLIQTSDAFVTEGKSTR